MRRKSLSDQSLAGGPQEAEQVDRLPDPPPPGAFLKRAILPSGSLKLDIALGAGGLPKGEICEYYGGDSSGKTTFCLHAIAQTQTAGGTCAYIDAEHALDALYAARCSVDANQLYLVQPQSFEQALDIADRLARSGGVDLLVIDSLTALLPQGERPLSNPPAQAGSQARLVSRWLPRLGQALRRSATTLIVTNQLRRRFGAVHQGAPASTASLALKLQASVRVELLFNGLITEAGQSIGRQVKARVVKNKFGPSFHTFLLDIMYNEGICRNREILDVASWLNIVHKQGSNYFYLQHDLGAGRQDALVALQQLPSLSKEIEQAIRRRMFPPHLMAVETGT